MPINGKEILFTDKDADADELPESERHFKTLAYAAPSWILNDWLARARKAGYYVERHGDDAAIVRLGGKVYLRAVNMRGSWIIRADPIAFKPDTGEEPE